MTAWAREIATSVLAVAGVAAAGVGALSLISSGLCENARVAAAEARDGWAFGAGGLVLLAAAAALRLS